MVNNLQQAFEKSTRKYFEQNSSDEEVDLEYPDLKTNVFREKNQNAKNITPKIKEIIGSKALAAKLSSSGKKLVDNVVSATASKSDKSTKLKESANHEKAIEKRGRKRKQKFKDKHKGKASKAGKRNHDDNDDDEDNDVDSEVDEATYDDDELDEPSPSKKMKKEKIEKPVKAAKKSATKKGNSKTVEPTPAPAPPAKKKKKNARKENIRASRDDDVRSEDEIMAEPEPVTPPKPNKNKKSKHAASPEAMTALTVVTGTAKHGQSNTKKDSGAKKSKVNKKRQASPVPDEIGASDVDLDEDVPVKPKATKERKVEKHAKANKKKGEKGASATVDAPEKKSKTAEKKKGKAKQKVVAAARSRSPSVASTSSSASLPAAKFTVDLHEKYSKSASHRNLDDEDGDDDNDDMPHPNTSKGRYKKPIELTPAEKTTARNRSPSPSVSQYSSEFSSRSGTPNTKLKDKFDLIKERRSRSNATVSSNNDDNKWNQIVKNAAKIKDKTKNDGKVQEKNQKLKETIEKLKQKNKQSKKLLNKLSDAKASANDEEATTRDETTEAAATSKSAFDLLRSESAGGSTKKSPAEKGKTKTKSSPVADADGADQSAGSSKKSLKKHKEKVNPATKMAKKSAKLLAKATGASGAATNKKANNNNNNNKANMEALELETEQTLKDINRWLEHTPRFPDFNSASNSPTRFNNLLDDFDTVTSKLDPADFGRPVPPITTEAATLSASDSKVDATSKTTAKTGVTDDAKEAAPPPPLVKAAPKQTIQLTGIPPPPGPHKRDKEPKKKSLKDKISAMVPKHVHRTIERLQPGKTKGNLIGTMHSSTAVGSASGMGPKANEESAAGGIGSTLSVSKSKEVKSSLVEDAKDTGPKLSLGSICTAGFGLGQQHNFSDSENTKGKHSRVYSRCLRLWVFDEILI